MSILPQNASNNFSLNGLQNTGTIPVLNQCPSALQNLIMDNITTGSISNYQIKIEKSTDNISYAAPIASTLFTTSSMPSAIDLNALFGSNLTNTYTGYLRVSLCVNASGQCDNGLYVKSQVFQISSITTLTDYNAKRTTDQANGIPDDKKPLQKILPISTVMPTGSTITQFRINLNKTQGWQGATSAGINNIVTNGNWSLSVYEVDGTTGIRKTQVIGTTTYTAPNIASTSGTTNTATALTFGDYSKAFNSASPTTFYVDQATNFTDGLYYFRDYYVWAKSQGVTALAAFSAKTYCCEFSATYNGCLSVNKSYFRIASTALNGGENARMKNPNTDVDFNLYPNPTTGLVNIQFASITKNSIIVIDNMGKIVKKVENINTSIYKSLNGGAYSNMLNNGADLTTTLNGIYGFRTSSNDSHITSIGTWIDTSGAGGNIIYSVYGIASTDTTIDSLGNAAYINVTRLA
jgi:hypothetical protein